MTNKKYILEENILDKNNQLIEYGHDHAIESWDTLPNEEEVKSRIQASAFACWNNKKAFTCQYALIEVEADKEGELFGECKILKRFKYEIDKARKNTLDSLLHEEFICHVKSCESWDDIEPEEYASHLEDIGLNYYKYDDPDMMFQDYKQAVKNLIVEIEEY